MPSSPSVASWRFASITAGCSVTLLTLLYWPTVASISARWSADPFGHGYVVIPVAAYLVWSCRADLERIAPRPALWAIPVLGMLAFVWLLGNLTGTDIVQQVCVVAMVAGLVWAGLGTAAARVLRFPLAFLLFALPLGDRLIPALQDFTARFTVKMLDLSGVPVLLQGHLISIPGSSWRVAEACGGINYLMSSLTIGYLYAGTSYKYWVNRIGFLVASALVPLIANGIRVYTTILIASLGGTRVVEGMGHYLYGWFVFAIIMGLLFATCGRWREDETVGASTDTSGTAVRPPLMRRTVAGPVFWAALALLVVGIAPLYVNWFRVPGHVMGSVRATPPRVSGPWRVADRDAYDWTPRFDGLSAEFLETYATERHAVKFYIAYYDNNQSDSKLATSKNVLFDDRWLATRTEGPVVTHLGQSFEVRETLLEGQSRSLVLWHWYWIDGTFTSNDYMAKLLLAKARLFKSDRPSAAIAVATEYRPGTDTPLVLKDFLAHVSFPSSSVSTASTAVIAAPGHQARALSTKR